jgi:putative nucleotidyltransferase with HDIG domain
MIRRPGDLVHLTRRFVTSLAPGPPAVVDEVWAESWLLPAEVELWRRLTNQDRRHCIQVARHFVAIRPAATRAEIAGALLHDIGKAEVGLSTVGRSLARALGPRTGRMRRYLDHERIGAEMLAAGGSDPVTVELVAERGDAFPDLFRADNAT